MGRATAKIILAPPLGEGSKGQISFNFNYKVNFKDFFLPNFVFVLTNERYKSYQTGFSFCHIGHAPGWDFVSLGVPRAGQVFVQTWLCDISNRRR